MRDESPLPFPWLRMMAAAAAIAVPWAVAIAIWLMLDWPLRLCVVAVLAILVALLLGDVEGY